MKAKIIDEWVRLLKPSGRVVTTARLREFSTDITDSLRSEFVQRAISSAASKGLPLPEMERVAIDYAANIESFPFEDQQDLRRLLKQFDSTLRVVQYRPKMLHEKEMAEPYYARMVLQRL